MDKRRDVFQAIADPTRREIIGLIANKALKVSAIAGHFRSSRPTISGHIKLLADCGLISIQQKGRERFCVATLDSLNDVYTWAEQYKSFWTRKLAALKQFVEGDYAGSLKAQTKEISRLQKTKPPKTRRAPASVSTRKKLTKKSRSTKRKKS